ncbi:MAG: hypothetical protein WC860_06130 [Candidatus Margulisiibacteriota bacterium]
MAFAIDLTNNNLLEIYLTPTAKQAFGVTFISEPSEFKAGISQNPEKTINFIAQYFSDRFELFDLQLAQGFIERISKLKISEPFLTNLRDVLLTSCFDAYNKATLPAKKEKLLPFAAGVLKFFREFSYTATSNAVVFDYIEVPNLVSQNLQPQSQYADFIGKAASKILQPKPGASTSIWECPFTKLIPDQNKIFIVGKEFPSEKLDSTKIAETFQRLGNATKFAAEFGTPQIDPKTCVLPQLTKEQIEARYILFMEIQDLWSALKDLKNLQTELETRLTERLQGIAKNETADSVQNNPENRILYWQLGLTFNPDFVNAINARLANTGVTLKNNAQGIYFLCRTRALGPGDISHGHDTCYLATALPIIYRSQYFQEVALGGSSIPDPTIGQTLHDFRQAIFPHANHDFVFTASSQIKPIESINLEALPKTPEIEKVKTTIKEKTVRFLETFVYKHLIYLKGNDSQQFETIRKSLKAIREHPQTGDALPYNPEESKKILDQLKAHPEFNYIQEFEQAQNSKAAISQFFESRVKEMHALANQEMLQITQEIDALKKESDFSTNTMKQEIVQRKGTYRLQLQRLIDLEVSFTPNYFKSLRKFNDFLSKNKEMKDMPSLKIQEAIEKIRLSNEIYQAALQSQLFEIYKNLCKKAMLPKCKNYIKALVTKIESGNNVTWQEIEELNRLLQFGKIYLHDNGGTEDPETLLTVLTDSSSADFVFRLEIPLKTKSETNLYSLINDSFYKLSNLPVEFSLRMHSTNTQMHEHAPVDLKPFFDFGSYLAKPSYAPYELTKVTVNTAMHWTIYIKENGQWYRINDLGEPKVRPVDFLNVRIMANQCGADLVFTKCENPTNAAEIGIQSRRQNIYLGKTKVVANPQQPKIPAFDFSKYKGFFSEKAAALGQLNFIWRNVPLTPQERNEYEQKINDLNRDINILFSKLETEINQYYLGYDQITQQDLTQENSKILKEMETAVNQLQLQVLLCLENDAAKQMGRIAALDPRYDLTARYLTITELFVSSCKQNGVSLPLQKQEIQTNDQNSEAKTAYNEFVDLINLIEPKVILNPEQLKIHMERIGACVGGFRFEKIQNAIEDLINSFNAILRELAVTAAVPTTVVTVPATRQATMAATTPQKAPLQIAIDAMVKDLENISSLGTLSPNPLVPTATGHTSAPSPAAVPASSSSSAAQAPKNAKNEFGEITPETFDTQALTEADINGGFWYASTTIDKIVCAQAQVLGFTEAKKDSDTHIFQKSTQRPYTMIYSSDGSERIAAIIKETPNLTYPIRIFRSTNPSKCHWNAEVYDITKPENGDYVITHHHFDPYGHGYKTISQSKELVLPFNESKYNETFQFKKQTDSSSCGPISADILCTVMREENLTAGTYSSGAKDLRKAQIQLLDQAIKSKQVPDPSLGNAYSLYQQQIFPALRIFSEAQRQNTQNLIQAISDLSTENQDIFDDALNILLITAQETLENHTHDRTTQKSFLEFLNTVKDTLNSSQLGLNLQDHEQTKQIVIFKRAKQYAIAIHDYLTKSSQGEQQNILPQIIKTALIPSLQFYKEKQRILNQFMPYLTIRIREQWQEVRAFLNLFEQINYKEDSALMVNGRINLANFKLKKSIILGRQVKELNLENNKFAYMARKGVLPQLGTDWLAPISRPSADFKVAGQSKQIPDKARIQFKLKTQYGSDRYQAMVDLSLSLPEHNILHITNIGGSQESSRYIDLDQITFFEILPPEPKQQAAPPPKASAASNPSVPQTPATTTADQGLQQAKVAPIPTRIPSPARTTTLSTTPAPSPAAVPSSARPTTIPTSILPPAARPPQPLPTNSANAAPGTASVSPFALEANASFGSRPFFQPPVFPIATRTTATRTPLNAASSASLHQPSITPSPLLAKLPTAGTVTLSQTLQINPQIFTELQNFLYTLYTEEIKANIEDTSMQTLHFVEVLTSLANNYYSLNLPQAKIPIEKNGIQQMIFGILTKISDQFAYELSNMKNQTLTFKDAANPQSPGIEIKITRDEQIKARLELRFRQLFWQEYCLMHDIPPNDFTQSPELNDPDTPNYFLMHTGYHALGIDETSPEQLKKFFLGERHSRFLIETQVISLTESLRTAGFYASQDAIEQTNGESHHAYILHAKTKGINQERFKHNDLNEMNLPCILPEDIIAIDEIIPLDSKDIELKKGSELYGITRYEGYADFSGIKVVKRFVNPYFSSTDPLLSKLPPIDQALDIPKPAPRFNAKGPIVPDIKANDPNGFYYEHYVKHMRPATKEEARKTIDIKTRNLIVDPTQIAEKRIQLLLTDLTAVCSPQERFDLLQNLDNFSVFAQQVIDKYYNVREGLEPEIWYMGNHKGDHAIRTVIASEKFINLVKTQLEIQVSPQEELLLRIASLYHDSGRFGKDGKDLKEQEALSARLFKKDMQEAGLDQLVSSQIFQEICDAIDKKDSPSEPRTIYQDIIQAADLLEVMRVREVDENTFPGKPSKPGCFDSTRANLFKRLTTETQQHAYFEIVKSQKTLIDKTLEDEFRKTVNNSKDAYMRILDLSRSVASSAVPGLTAPQPSRSPLPSSTISVPSETPVPSPLGKASSTVPTRVTFTATTLPSTAVMVSSTLATRPPVTPVSDEEESFDEIEASDDEEEVEYDPSAVENGTVKDRLKGAIEAKFGKISGYEQLIQNIDKSSLRAEQIQLFVKAVIEKKYRSLADFTKDFNQAENEKNQADRIEQQKQLALEQKQQALVNLSKTSVYAVTRIQIDEKSYNCEILTPHIQSDGDCLFSAIQKIGEPKLASLTRTSFVSLVENILKASHQLTEQEKNALIFIKHMMCNDLGGQEAEAENFPALSKFNEWKQKVTPKTYWLSQDVLYVIANLYNLKFTIATAHPNQEYTQAFFKTAPIEPITLAIPQAPKTFKLILACVNTHEIFKEGNHWELVSCS